MKLKTYIGIAKSYITDHPMNGSRIHKHVSLIVHKNTVVAIGINKNKTHPQAMRFGYKYGELHSELDAYIKLPKDMRTRKLTLINIGLNNANDVRMAKPCHKCMPWCNAVFTDIYYTDWDSQLKRLE